MQPLSKRLPDPGERNVHRVWGSSPSKRYDPQNMFWDIVVALGGVLLEK